MTCSATDGDGNVSTCTFTVRIDLLTSTAVPALGVGALTALLVGALVLGAVLIARRPPAA